MLKFLRFAPTLLLASSLLHAAHGCPAVELKPGMAVSQDCKVFRKITENGQQWIEYKGRRELIDCTKAQPDPFGGWHDYYAHIVDARFWCPTLDHFPDKYAGH